MNEVEHLASKRKIDQAIESIEKGAMDPWFHSKQSTKEWVSKLEPSACAEMYGAILDEMVRTRMDGRVNTSFRFCDLLVHVIDRARRQ